MTANGSLLDPFASGADVPEDPPIDVRWVEIDLVELDPENLEGEGYDDHDVELLRVNLSEWLASRPLNVYSVGDGHYRAWDGNHRLMAARAENMAKVPILVSERPPTKDHLANQLKANLPRREINPIVVARKFRRLVEAVGSNAIAAEITGVPETRVDNYLQVLQCCDQVQDLIRQKKLHYTCARALRKLPPAQQLDLATTGAEQHMGEHAFRDYVDRHRVRAQAGPPIAGAAQNQRQRADGQHHSDESQRFLDGQSGVREAWTPARIKEPPQAEEPSPAGRLPEDDPIGRSRPVAAAGGSAPGAASSGTAATSGSEQPARATGSVPRVEGSDEDGLASQTRELAAVLGNLDPTAANSLLSLARSLRHRPASCVKMVTHLVGEILAAPAEVIPELLPAVHWLVADWPGLGSNYTKANLPPVALGKSTRPDEVALRHMELRYLSVNWDPEGESFVAEDVSLRAAAKAFLGLGQANVDSSVVANLHALVVFAGLAATHAHVAAVAALSEEQSLYVRTRLTAASLILQRAVDGLAGSSGSWSQLPVAKSWAHRRGTTDLFRLFWVDDEEQMPQDLKARYAGIDDHA